MHDFGILAATKETADITGPDGEVTTVSFLVFRDPNGTEWHDLFKAAGPFDFYIAVNNLDRVISMEPNPESSQIAGHRIIGISTDEANGFTRGEGGSVYGKLWNGVDIVDPPQSRADYPILLPTTFWKAARQIGVTKAGIIASITAWPDVERREDALIDLEECSGFIRINPIVVSLTETYQITPEQLDSLWLWAASTQV